MCDILKKMRTTIKTGIVREEAIYSSNLSNDRLFTIETRIKKKVSYYLSFYCPRRKQKKPVASVVNVIAGKMSTMPNHEIKIIFLCNLWRILVSEVFLKIGAPKN